MSDVEKATDEVTKLAEDSGGSGDEQDGEVEVDKADQLEISLGCGILGRYPIISLLSFVVLGVCVGVGLSYWRPETEADEQSKAVALQWIGLVGDLFLRCVAIILLCYSFAAYLLYL